MTERGARSLVRKPNGVWIGNSGLTWTSDGLELEFEELALPWPGHRLFPKRVRGRIFLQPDAVNRTSYHLDAAGRHVWWPFVPQARVTVECDLLPGGGWTGAGYHDLNCGSRPLETDFQAWDWARGRTRDGRTLVLYDARMRGGARTTLGLSFSADGGAETISLPPSMPLPPGVWGVRGGIQCEEGERPARFRCLEDTPFYTRSLVDTTLQGQCVHMVHETLDCDRLQSPVVRMMLPFRMPRCG